MSATVETIFVLNDKLPEFITAIAAILAIAASGYFQNKTLRESRNAHAENAKHHKETVLASIVAGHRQNWIDNLREDISNYIPLTYEINMMFQSHMQRKEPLPDTYVDLALKENILRNRILLKLNPHETLHQELIMCLDALRDDKHKDLWIKKSERVLDCTRNILKAEWNRIKTGEISVHNSTDTP